jgi:hypothetical protein
MSPESVLIHVMYSSTGDSTCIENTIFISKQWCPTQIGDGGAVYPML